MLPHRVAVTGIGLVTPLGVGTQNTWDALCEGRSGIKRLDDPLLKDYTVDIAGVVPPIEEHLNLFLSSKEQHKTDRFSHLALLAAREAMSHAGYPDFTDEQKLRTGVYVGVGFGGLSSLVSAVRDLDQKGMRRISPYLIPKVISNEAACLVAIAWGLQGPALSVNSACSSGADAIGQAYRAIQTGVADAMLAGGAESCLSPLALAGFGNMRALARPSGSPEDASRPFDAKRNGFVMAEGAGILLLERWDMAVKRGATIYAELVGYGSTCDAYHTTALHPEGRGSQAALRQALQQAQITPDQVAYINAHGTSTQMNDVVETQSIKKVFGTHAHNGLLVSSTKSMTGHMLGAAGGVEGGIAALSLHTSVAPPTRNLDNPDPLCDLDYVAHDARTHNGAYALTNSFGFGGSNVVLAFKKV